MKNSVGLVIGGVCMLLSAILLTWHPPSYSTDAIDVKFGQNAAIMKAIILDLRAMRSKGQKLATDNFAIVEGR